MFFSELSLAVSQTTIVIALISLMGASLSIGFAMAMVFHYFDESIASKRQIIGTAIVVAIVFYAVIAWPDGNAGSPDANQPTLGSPVPAKKHPLLAHATKKAGFNEPGLR